MLAEAGSLMLRMNTIGFSKTLRLVASNRPYRVMTISYKIARVGAGEQDW